MLQRKFLKSTSILYGLAGGLLLPVMNAQATDFAYKARPEPASTTAVDGINAKIAGLGGSLSHESLYGTQGSIAMPLGRQFGLQLDGAAMSFDNRFVGTGGLHAFWRDPSRGLLGFYGSYTRYNARIGDVHVSNAGVEAEVYMGNWTLQGFVGGESGNSVTGTVNGLTQTIDVKSRITDQVNLAYYVNENWRTYVGHRYIGGKHALALGTEWGQSLGGGSMASLFVEGRVGEEKFDGVWGGLRIYWGQKDKTLIRRHREDDPIEWSTGIMGTFNNNTTTTTPASTPAPEPDPT